MEYEDQPPADDCAQQQQHEASSSTLYDWVRFIPSRIVASMLTSLFLQYGASSHLQSVPTSDPSAAVSVVDAFPTDTRTEQKDSAQEQNLEQNEKQDEEELDRGEGSDGDSSSSSSSDDDSYLEGVDPAMAAYMKELERKDYLHRREMMFTGAYIEAFKNNTLDEEAQCYDVTSDAFWTGRGSLKVDGVRARYTKSIEVRDNG